MLDVLTGPGGGSAYDTWATAKGLSAANNGANLDPDNDGTSNLAEFAFNGNPLQTFAGHLNNKGIPVEGSFSPDSQV